VDAAAVGGGMLTGGTGVWTTDGGGVAAGTLAAGEDVPGGT
jgi:hypothetical protein